MEVGVLVYGEHSYFLRLIDGEKSRGGIGPRYLNDRNFPTDSQLGEGLQGSRFSGLADYRAFSISRHRLSKQSRI